MQTDKIAERALRLEDISQEEALFIYDSMPTSELALLADMIRYKHVPKKQVTWQIDRNVNITNVCVSGCKFCNFHVKPRESERAFVTTIDEYIEKIEVMQALGGNQLLLQGGLHPKLDIVYYETLFKELKKLYPMVRLHALGPPEIYHIARISSISTLETLQRLVAAGLDSLPGAGAEILDSGVRRVISPGKCSAEDWLLVMGEAHQMGLATSATMMYGHVETPQQRVAHLIKLRELQKMKPANSYGFLSFIPWIFCSTATELSVQSGSKSNLLEYVRLISISRIVLNNITNIQASWLTMGPEAGQLCLHSGANDLGSIMIEENVVSSAGASYRLTAEEMQAVIIGAGFEPKLRNQLYQLI